jgi:flagellar hook assembly protein FlgD
VETPAPVPPAPAAPPPAPKPLLANLTLSPAAISPDGDGVADTTTVTYDLGIAAFVTASVTDSSGGTVATPVVDQRQGSGHKSWTWDGSGLPDGRYTFTIDVFTDDGRQASLSTDVLLDRTISGFAVDHGAFSPNGDGNLDTVAFSFNVAAAASVTLQLQQGATVSAVLFQGQVQPGPQRLAWDGAIPGGKIADGSYTVVLNVQDALATYSQTLPLVVDTKPPTLTLVSGPDLQFSLDEPATVNLTVDGQQQSLPEPAGQFQVPHAAAPTQVSATATDGAGNTSAAVTWP